jgi:hypothetical protein
MDVHASIQHRNEANMHPENDEKYCVNPKCLKLFAPKRPWQIYCSFVCRVTSDKYTLVRTGKVITCPHCNEEIDLRLIKENKK